MVGLFVCMHVAYSLTMSPLFLLRFAVCDQCILIEDNIKKAGKNVREREIWQKAKKIHREYVSNTALKILHKMIFKQNKEYTSFYCVNCHISLCRSSCSKGCTCTAAPIAHTTGIACIQRLMEQIKLLLDCRISIRMTNVHKKG